jgi:hypothetical protein
LYGELQDLQDLQDRGYLIKSDFRLICGYFFVTGIHNKSENEILSYRTL